MKSQQDAGPRIYFFDHVRYLMVLLVIVLHSACAYSRYTTWWHVNDTNAEIFDYILGFLGVFLMPTLFFIAGYFALPSIEPKGTGRFIVAKLKRLGIPCLLGVLLAGPYFKYIRLRLTFPSIANFWERFTENIKMAMTMNTGLINSPLAFQHHYFWFISLLLIFFLIFALLYRIRWMFSQKDTPPSSKSILIVLLIVSLLSSILAFGVHGVLNRAGILGERWIIIASLIQFQTTRIVMYIFCFTTGIYAYSRNWFQQGKVPGHYILWGVLSIILYLCFRKTGTMLMTGLSIPVAALWVLLRHFLVYFFLMTFISFSVKHWNKPNRINNLLSASSYHIYLVHMVLVVTFQSILKRWFWGVTEFNLVYLKFIIVVAASILFSFLISKYAIRPYPKRSVAGIIVLAGIMMVIL